MEARAYLKYARISPRKVSILLDLIRKQPADKAKAILKNTPKSGSELLLKLLDFLIILCDSCCRRHITALNLSQFIYKVFHSFALFCI